MENEAFTLVADLLGKLIEVEKQGTQSLTRLTDIVQNSNDLIKEMVKKLGQ